MLWMAIGWLVVSVGAGVQPEAARDDGWDAAFTRTSGWNGGDIGHSIDLGDGRTLWLFGDSIVGPVQEGRRVGGKAVMVRGAIGWHIAPIDAGPAREVEFALPEGGHGVAEAAWTRPAEGLFAKTTWYWLMGDGAVVKDEAGQTRFVFFATAIDRAGNPEGMWDFRRVGGAVITVENPGDEPDAWRAVQKVNPLVTETARHGEAPKTSENWGLAIVRWTSEDESERLYIYGLRSEAPGDNTLLVARCAEQDLDEPEAWTFFDGTTWVGDPGAAAGIALNLVDEFTIQAVHRNGRDDLVLVQSEPILGHHILVRTAMRPEGPWSEPAKVYEVTEPADDERLITYAAKGHAHLSRPGSLLITYVINSADFGQIFRDASLYRPRFVRVGHEALPAAPE